MLLIRSKYISFCGPFPVITTRILGSFLLIFRVVPSYLRRASRSNEKSSSGVQLQISKEIPTTIILANLMRAYHVPCTRNQKQWPIFSQLDFPFLILPCEYPISNY